jgi:hypothetical protein
MQFTIRTVAGPNNSPPCSRAFETAREGQYIVWAVEINTLEELLAIVDEVDNQLVIDRELIIVYDGYLE